MKKILTSLLIGLLCNVSLTGQDLAPIIEESCDCLEKLFADEEKAKDKQAFMFGSEACYKSAYDVSISYETPQETNAFMERFYAHMAKQCPAFSFYGQALSKFISTKMESRVKKKKKCQKIMRTGKFIHLFGTSEDVIVTMMDSVQIVTFGSPDIYTKSRVEWQDECSYKLIHLESTNPFENSIVSPGGQRLVHIVDIKDNGEIILETEFFGSYYLGRYIRLED